VVWGGEPEARGRDEKKNRTEGAICLTVCDRKRLSRPAGEGGEEKKKARRKKSRKKIRKEPLPPDTDETGLFEGQRLIKLGQMPKKEIRE